MSKLEPNDERLEDKQLDEALEIEDESQLAPETNRNIQKQQSLPENAINRTHEINDLVSKEELALLLSNDFLFGNKISIEKE